MNEKKCATPECDYGRYVTSAGRCPRRNELRPRSWESRPFHFVPSHLYLCLSTNFCIALTLISNNVLTAAISWWRHPRIDESKSFGFLPIQATIRPPVDDGVPCVIFPVPSARAPPVSFRSNFSYTPFASLYRIFTIFYSPTVSYNLHTNDRPSTNYLEKQQRKK